MTIPKKLIYTRYFVALFNGILMGTSSESFSYMITQNVINDHKGLISNIYMILSIIGCLQFLTTKIKLKYAIWLPIFYDLISIPYILYLFLNNMWYYGLIIYIVNETFIGMMFVNRKNKIMEIIKSFCKMDNYFNKLSSIISVGGIIGYCNSAFLLKYIQINYSTMPIIILITWGTIGNSILIYENILIHKEMKNENNNN